MLVILITSDSIQSSRETQDRMVLALGENCISPILWVQFVAVRTPPSVVVFSSRYVGNLIDSQDFDFVLTDYPVEEAVKRATY